MPDRRKGSTEIKIIENEKEWIDMSTPLFIFMVLRLFR